MFIVAYTHHSVVFALHLQADVPLQLHWWNTFDGTDSLIAQSEAPVMPNAHLVVQTYR
jgi:hypothetical protein